MWKATCTFEVYGTTIPVCMHVHKIKRRHIHSLPTNTTCDLWPMSACVRTYAVYILSHDILHILHVYLVLVYNYRLLNASLHYSTLPVVMCLIEGHNCCLVSHEIGCPKTYFTCHIHVDPENTMFDGPSHFLFPWTWFHPPLLHTRLVHAPPIDPPGHIVEETGQHNGTWWAGQYVRPSGDWSKGTVSIGVDFHLTN